MATGVSLRRYAVIKRVSEGSLPWVMFWALRGAYRKPPYDTKKLLKRLAKAGSFTGAGLVAQIRLNDVEVFPDAENPETYTTC